MTKEMPGENWQYVISIIGLLIIGVGALVALYSRSTALESKQIDIQNQLCAQDTVRNVMAADEYRVDKILYENAFPGHAYDIGNAFYPTVGQCGGGQRQ